MRTLFLGAVLVLGPLAGMPAVAATAESGDTIAIQDMILTVPDGYTLEQNAKDEGTIILGFGNDADAYVTIYVKAATGLDMRSIFQNGSQVVRDIRAVPRNSFAWELLETKKTISGVGRGSGSQTAYVASFMVEHGGHSYYGYARGSSSADALTAASAFLDNLR